MRSEVIKLNYYQSRGCNIMAFLSLKMTRLREGKKETESEEGLRERQL